ncbi:MAG: cyclic nucleotide-binding domain-containing protein [Pseudomonadota bacterium]
MLADVELTPDFQLLSQQYSQLARSLLATVNIPPISVEAEATVSGNFRGFDAGKFYVIESGSITVRYRGKAIYILEEGDLLLPDITGASEGDNSAYYGSEAGASLGSYPAIEFLSEVMKNPAATKLWTRLLITYSGMMLRLNAARIPEELPSTPGFEIYEPGDVIIHQGDRADYVFNMTSGVAEVVVDGVTVGRIAESEIFGAMAALTHADRSATVVAKTECSVVKVPKEQFTDLIKSNPATIHSLLVDMANSIVNLNEQLVGLRGTSREP